MSEFQKATIEIIGGGNAINQFNFELQKAIENCQDLNTEAATPRTVTLKVTLKPSSDRKDVALTYQATSKLAPDSPGIDMLYISKGEAYVQDMQQMGLEEFLENKLQVANGGEK